MNISPGALFLKIKTLIYKLNPAPAVYGLEISDVALRLVDATRKEPRAVSLRLPPGIIEGGEIRDREVLRQALNEMRKGFSGSSSPLHVVLVVPSDHVFLQSFSIPALEEGREEAILLNVQSLSPRSLEEMRYGYEERGIEGESVGKLSIMAGFMEKRVIDVFHDTAQSALFMPVVIEFRSMALARVLKERGLLKGSGEMFVHIEADGILLAALGTGLPLFERFIRWSEVGDEKNASRALSY